MVSFDILKMVIVMLMLSLVTAIHHFTTCRLPFFFGMHIFDRELFFFPIVLAGIWFGLKVALFPYIAGSILYAQFFTRNIDLHSTSPALVVLQVLGFN